MLFFFPFHKAVFFNSHVQIWVGPSRRPSTKELMLLNCGVGEDSWETVGLQGDQTSPSWRKSFLNIHWKDWFWSWNSNTLATWCEQLTCWKRPWCWERLRAGEGATDDEMVGWHHQLNGYEFEWTLGVGDRQGGLACCSSWDCKALDTTEQLNWTYITEIKLISTNFEFMKSKYNNRITFL